MESTQLLTSIVIASIFFVFGFFASKLFSKNNVTTKFKGLRKLSEAITMIQTYNDNPLRGKPTTSGFIPNNDFEGYINYVKQLVSNKDGLTLCGFQYYFARYTENTTIAPDHIDHNTLVIFPVVKDSKGNISVRDLISDRDINSLLQTLKSKEGNEFKSFSTSEKSTQNSTAFDMSQMSPPRPPGGQ